MKRNGIVQAIELTKRQSTVLKNMHWRRRKAIRQRMKNGGSFSAAEKGTQHVFDTVNWSEITSRLRRARGLVRKWTGIIENWEEPIAGLSQQICDFATRISNELAALRDLLGENSESRPSPVETTANDAPTPAEKYSNEVVLGKFKAAFKFVAKSRRDAPLLLRNQIEPTDRERATVANEIGFLLEDCARLLS